MRLKDEEIKLKNLAEKKIIEDGIIEEQRAKDEEQRIKDWERKFDKEQIKKEEELIKKFNNQLIKDKEESEEIIEFKKEEKIEEVIKEVIKEENEKY